jgi:hypothetical protein
MRPAAVAAASAASGSCAPSLPVIQGTGAAPPGTGRW